MGIEQLKNEIKDELSGLTNHFLDKEVALKVNTEQEKNIGVEILRDYYDIVEVSDGRRSLNDKMNWVISCVNPKPVKESLTEADEEEFEEPALEDDADIDLSDFDNPNDDMDLSDEYLDTIDDVGEVDKAEQLTLLKKRASTVGDKWREMFSEISLLARDLGLVATHDDKLNIELKKPNGERSEFEQDLKDIKKKVLPNNDEIDDSFGPSEFDDRASKLGPDVQIQSESLENTLHPAFVNEQYPYASKGTVGLSTAEDANELYLDPNRIDDDF